MPGSAHESGRRRTRRTECRPRRRWWRTQRSEMVSLAPRGGELERLVEGEHRPFCIRALDEEGDLDRRGDDEARLDTDLAERSERARRDTGMAVEPRADQGRLRQHP